jgi:hypothetical protein
LLLPWRKYCTLCLSSRSRWPSGLRYVLSLFARRPGSWVWIPLRAWMFNVCVSFPVFR